MTLAITFCSSFLSCPYRFHDMLVRSVALLIIDAIGLSYMYESLSMLFVLLCYTVQLFIFLFFFFFYHLVMK